MTDLEPSVDDSVPGERSPEVRERSRIGALRIAVLVKQVPRFEAMELRPDGRLQRQGMELEMNPYCRRAVSRGVTLAAATGGSCTVFTLGPPDAEEVLREAVAGGADDAVLITDPNFAGSDTLATARALSAAVELHGPFDLVLLGRNSVDADTGQVGPELAELLGLPFLAAVRELELVDDELRVVCEREDGTVRATVRLPAVVTCAERLCDPTKEPPEARAAVDDSRLVTLDAAALGPGPFGAAGSPTTVSDVRLHTSQRRRLVMDGTIERQVEAAVAILADARALDVAGDVDPGEVAQRAPGHEHPAVAVLVEPGHQRSARELLGVGVLLAASLGEGEVVALAASPLDPETAGSWGADRVIATEPLAVEEDVAHTFLPWIRARRPAVVLAPGTLWGREVASRIAARLGAGLTGDAVDLAIDAGRLVAWKPAFGGQLVAAVIATSDVQLATVRPGVLPLHRPRPHGRPATVEPVDVVARSRVVLGERRTDDHEEPLAAARAIVGVGAGVDVGEYGALDGLCRAIGAELGATRKVTDKGWLPRSRQIGITGHSVSPRLYLALGIRGAFNHTLGVRGAGFILAVNNDPGAPIFDVCDVGIVADWRDAVPLLAEALLDLPAIARTRSHRTSTLSTYRDASARSARRNSSA